MPDFIDTYGWRDGLVSPFGRRPQPPQLPAYRVWIAGLYAESQNIVHATTSFEARRSYVQQRNAFAGDNTLTVTDVAARRVGA